MIAKPRPSNLNSFQAETEVKIWPTRTRASKSLLASPGFGSRSRSLGLTARRTLAPRPSASSTAPWTRARAILGTRVEAARQREDGTSLERDCALHACGERDPRKHPKHALWPKLSRSRLKYIACGVSAVWRVRSCSIGGAGPRPGTRPARPAGRPRPTRAGEEGPGAGRPGRGRRPHTNPHLELANLFRIVPRNPHRAPTEHRTDVLHTAWFDRMVRRWTRSSDEIYVWRH
jgi:hypothetical protein